MQYACDKAKKMLATTKRPFVTKPKMTDAVCSQSLSFAHASHELAGAHFDEHVGESRSFRRIYSSVSTMRLALVHFFFSFKLHRVGEKEEQICWIYFSAKQLTLDKLTNECFDCITQTKKICVEKDAGSSSSMSE